MTRAFLIRHGSCHGITQSLMGRTPGIHLNDEGLAQARDVAELLAREHIEAVYTSPLARARETARIIAQRCSVPVRSDDAFCELDFGSWTRLTFQVLESDPLWFEFNRYRSRVTPPNGESPVAAQARAVTRLNELARAHTGHGIALVTHADIIRSILCDCERVPLDDLLRYNVEVGSITVLEHDGRWHKNRGPALATLSASSSNR
jgi:broad specificity phosphatase PhoE